MTTPAATTTETLHRPNSAPAAAAPRTSRLGAATTLYLLTLRQHLHGKRWIALTLLFLLPAGLAILIRVTGSEVPSRFLEFLMSWILIPQALLPLVALLYASGIIQDEQEEQTITYLLVRPIPKGIIYAVKMLATWTTTVLLVAALTPLTYLAIYLESGTEVSEVSQRCLDAVAIHSLAVIAYCSLFGLMSLVTKRILVAGIIYSAVVEGLLASFPLSLRMATVIYYTRLLAYRTMDFTIIWRPGRRPNDVAATAWSFDTSTDPMLAEHPDRLTCTLVLLAASVACTLLAAWLCSQREFHVKTPEKE
jgi:ABC-2 type transport system permease protein